MSDNPIDVDPMLPATLRWGDKTVHCLSTEEAVVAFHELPTVVRSDATLRVAGGTIYAGDEIGRLRCRAPTTISRQADSAA
jgi:hypothetical protein